MLTLAPKAPACPRADRSRTFSQFEASTVRSLRISQLRLRLTPTAKIQIAVAVDVGERYRPRILDAGDRHRRSR